VKFAHLRRDVAGGKYHGGTQCASVCVHVFCLVVFVPYNISLIQRSAKCGLSTFCSATCCLISQTRSQKVRKLTNDYCTGS
jgi:hypothetical protein